MHTTINYSEFGVKHSEEFEEQLDVIRSKTGLGYKMSKFKAYIQPKKVDTTKIMDKLTSEVKSAYRDITGRYIPYFERKGFNDSGYECRQHDQDLTDEMAFDRRAMIDQIMNVPTCQVRRSQLVELSTDKLIRIVERLGGGK